ncbi:5-dehydro-2-deoxygluconokinase [Conexibacter arvalis]|uniref:5-dehydro-2-deoxygluconokinase n=1 Tax=Conexibacter arvalis TaxID=912552 RepID=A0A840IBQ3_9ACTN|nr:5-dehydro-2-deoxygluconokinase [Conexibacter arvalis]
MSALDVIAIGRIGVDLYPEQHGRRLADVESFRKGLGGSATNVAVAAARLGRRSAVVTRVGEDPWGVYCREALAAYGVDARWVGTDPRLRTPVTFCEVHPPDDFPLLFYREPTAPDLEVSVEQLDPDAIAAAGLVWTTGTGLSREPSRTAVLTALDLRTGEGRRRLAVHDLDDRPMLWPEGERHADWSAEAVRHATVVVGNRAEAAVAVGDLPPREQAQALLELGPEIAIVKQGPAGVLGATRAGEVVELPATPVEVVCGLGAGDAFGGALCHGLLAGWPLERVLRFASAAGAIVAGRLLCAAAMPTAEEVEAHL